MQPRLLSLLIAFAGASAICQAPALHSIATIKSVPDRLRIEQNVRAGVPFTVAGPQGVLVGQQEGTFESWLLPVKLLSHFSMRALVEGYPVPIELNPIATSLQVFPDRTVITYSHIALTVRQTMFAPADAPEGTGAVVLFEVDAVHPVDLTFSFTPEMRPMWPKPSPGTASPEWVAKPGAYILHTDSPDLAGAVAIPTAQPGTLAPYQEKPQVHPLEFKLHVDPVRDRGKAFPLLMAVGQTALTATNDKLLGRLQQLNDALPEVYIRHASAYDQLQARLTSIETPDRALNDDFRWAEISIEQLRAQAQPEPTGALNGTPETGLVAGYFSSGDSARPGFGWYFGRDTLYTLYAVNGMGDFALTRDALAFLLRRQRADGKMMHEYSQTAASVEWKNFPYMYAAADATPLFLMAMMDYVRASGDVDFLRAHREEVMRAWQFETTHDSDGDGIYDNVQGTGWVESWPGGQPHQEIYLALLDQQASAAMVQLSTLLGDNKTHQQAELRAQKLSATIESEYYQPSTGEYAFSRNADGSLDRIRTLYPTLAWWSEGSGLKHPDASLRAWDSHDFSTDWGTRDVAESDPIYDSMSYHQGSVWPLFTGWAALADYRSHRPLSGYAHLRQNADQTTTQDPGAVTELLSGAFFEPFGRSTSHQLWSSAMVITPILRGLFGLQLDARANTVTVDPQLPADWPAAEVKNLHVGASSCDLSFSRRGQMLEVAVKTTHGPRIALSGGNPAHSAMTDTLRFPLPPVEVSLPTGLPLAGSRTTGIKVLSTNSTPHSLILEVEGMAGTTSRIAVRRNAPKLQMKAEGVSLSSRSVDGLEEGSVTFPYGTGYQKKTVTLNW